MEEMNTKTVPVEPTEERRTICDALLSYHKADTDGVMVVVSRQAIHEAVGLIASLAAAPPQDRHYEVTGPLHVVCKCDACMAKQDRRTGQRRVIRADECDSGKRWELTDRRTDKVAATLKTSDHVTGYAAAPNNAPCTDSSCPDERRYAAPYKITDCSNLEPGAPEPAPSKLPLSVERIRSMYGQRSLLYLNELCDQALAAVELERENVDLRHDIARSTERNSQLLAENARLNHELAMPDESDVVILEAMHELGAQEGEKLLDLAYRKAAEIAELQTRIDGALATIGDALKKE